VFSVDQPVAVAVGPGRAVQNPVPDRPRIAALRVAPAASASMAYPAAQVAPSWIVVVHPSIPAAVTVTGKVHDLETGPARRGRQPIPLHRSGLESVQGADRAITYRAAHLAHLLERRELR